MPHRKSSFFFILLLLGSFCQAVAQTDSGVVNKKDTDNAGIHAAADTALARIPARKPGHLKKSDSAAAARKSGPSPVSVSGIRKDSVFPQSGTVSLSVDTLLAASKGIKGADLPALFRSVLKSNPWFNFTGKAFVREMQRHNPDSKDILFYLLLGVLFYFALVRIFFEKYFDNLLTLFFRVSIRQQQIREQVLQTPLPSLLLNILFIISGGLYACWLVRYYHLAADINFWILLVNCMGALGVIYLGKFLLLKFCGWVFNISRATDIYIFVVFLVNKMMGIFLLPFLVILFFSGPTVGSVFVTISLSMILAFFIYRVIASYRPVRNEIKLTPFHFFLYLCAFEIAPLLLIYKVLLTYLEKAY